MSWITEIFSSSVGGVVDSLGDAIDKVVTSDEEKLQLRNELVRIKSEAEKDRIELANRYEEEITKRNASDQTSGNFLTKSARPLFLYWIMFIVTMLIFGGFAGLVVAPGYIDLITALAITTVTFFFGSKGFEAYKHGRIL